ncbi:MAG: UvrB/UvrC motif-containing protein [Planctomycetota bacterium]
MKPGSPQVLHLCEEHARQFLSDDSDSTLSSIAEALKHQLKLEDDDEDMSSTQDSSSSTSCPFCGITFADFRATGRLGCPYDYTVFADQLGPLMKNIHGRSNHAGKTPSRWSAQKQDQLRILNLRGEMQRAAEEEDYELAGKIRDSIRQFESGHRPSLLGDDEAAADEPAALADGTISNGDKIDGDIDGGDRAPDEDD